MSKEELKKEAEQYSFYQIEQQLKKIQKAYLAGAEPREKRIAELEAQIKQLEKENAELKEISVMQSDSAKQLDKAKKIIREYMNRADWKGNNCPSFASICIKTE